MNGGVQVIREVESVSYDTTFLYMVLIGMIFQAMFTNYIETMQPHEALHLHNRFTSFTCDAFSAVECVSQYLGIKHLYPYMFL